MTERSDRPSGGGEGGSLGLDGLTEDILPALIARLRASRLGELEVRTSDWRIRLRRDLRATHRAVHSGAEGIAPDEAEEVGGSVRAPAVGYFNPLPELAVGQLLGAGDPLGSIDVLGINQDVLAPGGGIVRAILAEPGQAVEYGQALVEIDPLLVEPATPDDGAAARESGGTAEPEPAVAASAEVAAPPAVSGA